MPEAIAADSAAAAHGTRTTRCRAGAEAGALATTVAARISMPVPPAARPNEVIIPLGKSSFYGSCFPPIHRPGESAENAAGTARTSAVPNVWPPLGITWAAHPARPPPGGGG